MCFQASLATFEKLVFFVLFIYEIPGGHLHRHSQQFLVHVQAWCLFYSSEIKVVFVPSEGWIPRLQRGLFELSSAFANCGWNTVRDFKTAGKPHPKPSHCCSETPQQSSGRRVYCVDCWSSGSRLFHPEMLPTVAVWFLAGVHVLGALCSWTFLIKSTLWFWLCVFIVDMKTPPLAQLNLCAIMFKTKRLMLSLCHVGISEEMTSWFKCFIFEALWRFTVTTLGCRFLLLSCFTCALSYGVHVLQRAKYRYGSHKWQIQQVVCSCPIFPCQQKGLRSYGLFGLCKCERIMLYFPC